MQDGKKRGDYVGSMTWGQSTKCQMGHASCPSFLVRNKSVCKSQANVAWSRIRKLCCKLKTFVAICTAIANIVEDVINNREQPLHWCTTPRKCHSLLLNRKSMYGETSYLHYALSKHEIKFESNYASSFTSSKSFYRLGTRGVGE